MARRRRQFSGIFIPAIRHDVARKQEPPVRLRMNGPSLTVKARGCRRGWAAKLSKVAEGRWPARHQRGDIFKGRNGSQ